MANEVAQMNFGTNQSKPQYQSYLLRLWRTDSEKAWRMMLECIDTHERHGFSGIEGLNAFLREQMNDQNQTGNKNGNG